MARVGRLAGALLVETEGHYFLVGDTKAPCAWENEGFEPVPKTRDPLGEPVVKLEATRAIDLAAPRLTLALEGEDATKCIASRFLIERNGSVSERLWRLALGADESGKSRPDVDARWLGELPAPVWQIVRDTVLRCI